MRQRSGLARLAALTGIGLALFLPAPAVSAQGLFGGLAGDGCRAFQEAGGPFWQGFYRGREESPFTQDDGLYEVRHYRCFRSEAECDAWLYDLQSTYVATHRTWCRAY
ncbi:hypothetical protein [Pararhizobium haloflavum]|uniref:hypothetical protein n=1 Tax=Pararhizobium haloflavum TaxID=2037914 RepID=UPI0012FFF7B8|nr:hypothetical protein [Pararhizobium haloflavum]